MKKLLFGIIVVTLLSGCATNVRRAEQEKQRNKVFFNGML